MLEFGAFLDGLLSVLVVFSHLSRLLLFRLVGHMRRLLFSIEQARAARANVRIARMRILRCRWLTATNANTRIHVCAFILSARFQTTSRNKSSFISWNSQARNYSHLIRRRPHSRIGHFPIFFVARSAGVLARSKT